MADPETPRDPVEILKSKKGPPPRRTLSKVSASGLASNLLKQAQRMSAKRLRNSLSPNASRFSKPRLPDGVPMPEELGRRSSKIEGIRDRSVSSQSAVSEARRDEIIIRSGELNKKGIINTTWKKRFFILTNKSIYYWGEVFDIPADFSFLDANPRGQIPLILIDTVRRDTKTKEAFMISAPTRTYRVKAESVSQAEAWIGAILGAVENAKQQHSHAHGAGRKTSVSSLKADELDAMVTPLDIPLDIPNPTEILKSAGPHRPASINDYTLWSRFDVAAWLWTIGNLGNLGKKYSEVFYQNNVDGQRLHEIANANELEGIGVSEKEDRTEIMKGINNLRELYNQHHL